MTIDRCIRDLNNRGVLPELKGCTECDGQCNYYINWTPPVAAKETWSDWVKRKWFYVRIVFDVGWQAIAGRFKRRK